MSVVSVETIGGTVPMKGDGLESRIFDKSFDGFAVVKTGPTARVGGRPAAPPPPPPFDTAAGGGPSTRVESKPNKPLPPAPVEHAPLHQGQAVSRITNPDDVTYARVHKEVYLDLKTRDVLISKLQVMISTTQGTARLHRAFVDLSTMAISTKTFAKVSWSLDASLVPCHIAGCLGMVTYISVGKTIVVAPLYKRYARLVHDMLTFSNGDSEEHGKEFAAMVARHAETTADYVAFFVLSGDVIRLSVEHVNGMNAKWMNQLLVRMDKHVALARVRFAAERTALAAVVSMGGKAEDEGGAASERTLAEPCLD